MRISDGSSDVCSSDLLELTSSEIQFVTLTGAVAFGFEAGTLPKFCDVFLDAERAGTLSKNQKHIEAAARRLYRSFATLGIVALVDEATGFQDESPKEDGKSVGWGKGEGVGGDV